MTLCDRMTKAVCHFGVTHRSESDSSGDGGSDLLLLAPDFPRVYGLGMITLKYRGNEYELPRTPEVMRLVNDIAGRTLTITEGDSLELDIRAEPLFEIEALPQLGLATTEELLEEIAARGRTETYYTELGGEMSMGAKNLMDRLPGSMLKYRTAGS